MKPDTTKPLPATFCVLPWVHFHVGYKGNVRPCCINSKTVGNINKDNWERIWNGEELQMIRDSMLEGKKVASCSLCYQLEAAGKRSIRLESNEKFKHKITDIGKQVSSPVYLDIRWSNHCNLKCRTCWHGASSKWYEDAVVLGKTLGRNPLIRHVNSPEKLLDTMKPILSTVEECYFAGGEPLLQPETYKLLERFIETGNKTVFIRYNTNLTTLKLKERSVLELWKNFSNVQVDASLDATEEKGSYIRHGSKWDQILTNWDQIMEKTPHVKLKLTPTVSILNVHEVPHLHKEFVRDKRLLPHRISLNILQRPEEYNIKMLPDTEKKTIAQLYQKHTEWILENALRFPRSIIIPVIEDFKGVISYLNSSSGSKPMRKFLEETEMLDDLRQESLATTFPNLQKVIKHT